jgi:O-antigen/teichoic acid export membrane protein
MTIAKNSLALLASKLTILGFGFIFVVFAARMLGVEEFGKWALTRSFFDFALNLCAAGLNTVLIRDIARDPENTSRYLTTSAVFAMGPLLIVSAGVVLVARASGYADDTQLAIYLVIVALLPAVWSTMVEGAFVGREKAEYVGSVTLAENLFRTSLSFLVILMGHGVVALTVVLLASKILMLLAYVFLFHRKAGRLSFVMDWSFMRKHFATWQVFAAENWMANFYLGTGTIILSLFHGERAVGAFAAADRVLGWIGLFSHSYTNAVYPHMSRLFGESDERLRRLIENSVKFMLVFIIPFGVLVTVFADRIVLFLYTEAFAEAIPLMQLLVWIPVLRFLNTFFSRVLFARREQGRALVLAAIALTVYLAVALALVPAWAGVGMAWAKIAGVGAATAVFFWLVFGSEGVLRPLANLGKIAIAASLAGAAAMALKAFPLALPLGVAMLLYLGFLFAFRVASAGDLVLVQKLAAAGLQRADRLRGRA